MAFWSTFQPDIGGTTKSYRLAVTIAIIAHPFPTGGTQEPRDFESSATRNLSAINLPRMGRTLLHGAPLSPRGTYPLKLTK